jgi:hypothetical protein
MYQLSESARKAADKAKRIEEHKHRAAPAAQVESATPATAAE